MNAYVFYDRMLSFYRAASGKTQQELAKDVGVSQGSVRNWESGISKPKSARVPQLAEALGVSVCDISNLPGQPGDGGETVAENQGVYGGRVCPRNSCFLDEEEDFAKLYRVWNLLPRETRDAVTAVARLAADSVSHSRLGK